MFLSYLVFMDASEGCSIATFMFGDDDFTRKYDIKVKIEIIV
jgi:hypothetical protein